MISGQHRHKGGTGDGAKISYNDLTDKPSAAASTLYAAGQFGFASTGTITCTTGFTPKFIQFFSVGKTSQGSNIESGCVSQGTYIVATNTGTCTYLWHITDSSLAAGGGGPRQGSSNAYPIVLSCYSSGGVQLNVIASVSATSSTGFTINISTFGFGDTVSVQWTAFG